MALESTTYLSGLDSNNPAATDTVGQGDDHIRLIKAALKATFPNFTAAALDSTQSDIDAVVAANVNGETILADAGVNFKTHTTDGLRNPAAGEVDVAVGGAVGLKVTAATVTAPAALAVVGAATAGSVSSTGAYSGGTGQLVPIGGTLLWWEDTLPPEGGYAWVNGQIIANANTVCPVLLARWGNKFGGNGTTTMGVPDLRDSSPIGKGTMGATTAAGRITNFTTTVLGALIGGCNKVLTQAHLPALTLDVSIPEGQGSHYHPNTKPTATEPTGGDTQTGTAFEYAALSNSGTAVLPAMTGTVDTGGSGTAVDTVSPSTVCNYIIRLG